MSAFVILLHEDEPLANEKLSASIEEKFPDSEHFKFSSHAYLVTGERLVSDVIERLGFDDDDTLFAAVLRLNGSYSGRSWLKLWDWMQSAEASV